MEKSQKRCCFVQAGMLPYHHVALKPPSSRRGRAWVARRCMPILCEMKMGSCVLYQGCLDDVVSCVTCALNIVYVRCVVHASLCARHSVYDLISFNTTGQVLTAQSAKSN